MRHLSRLLVTIAAVAAGLTLHAQSLPLSETSVNDIQARFSAALEIPLGTKFALQWSEEARLKNNLGSVDKILSGLGVEYEPKKLDATDGLAVALCHWFIRSSPLPSATTRHAGVARKHAESWESFLARNPEREVVTKPKTPNKKQL